MSDITVIGIGAMGGGMARSLMESPVSKFVTAYDRDESLTETFFQESATANKARLSARPSTMKEAVHEGTDFVLLVLQTEPQCQAVCFGEDGLYDILPENASTCVILCSTVTAAWSKAAAEKFESKGFLFVDSPISGGPARARAGDLTIMASGKADTLEKAQPLLDTMGRPGDVYIIQGGAGMGSTVKMVHQLLAGVHIAVAAEALALAAKAGLDVRQLYQLVNGAAGTSWMFQNRGQRMMDKPKPDEKVLSQLQIFVKDLDIVYSEAKRLQSPIPLASAALQQFISGQSLGLGRQDDSQVVQVYENITKVSVSAPPLDQKEGSEVGDFWRMEDGRLEEIYEVGSEPRHFTVLKNEFVRALRVSFPPNDTTLAHRHAEDSLYFFLVEGGLDVINHVQGADPQCDCLGFGEVRYGTHKTDKPLVHRITNRSNQTMLCVDAEVLQRPPVTAAIPLVADKHELIKTRDKCRVYELTLQPGESVTVTYPFFHLTVARETGKVTKSTGTTPSLLQWTETCHRGDVAWKEPVMNITKTNAGDSTFVEYIAEWR